ncbi:MAG: cation:proton antiporter [Rhodobacterales bacterium]|nr:MAG: cation:proton antiporter [Rhodobacterales bacterium]
MTEIILYAAGVLVALAFLLAMIRFATGPRGVDRVVAFDVSTILSIGAIVIAAVVSGRGIYLDVALVYALLSFLGVIVAARYLEGGE